MTDGSLSHIKLTDTGLSPIGDFFGGVTRLHKSLAENLTENGLSPIAIQEIKIARKFYSSANYVICHHFQSGVF